MKSKSVYFYKVVSKTKNPLDGFVVKSYLTKLRPEGYFPTEEAAHYHWLVNEWRPRFNPVKTEKQLYRISVTGGGYFFSDHYKDDAKSLIENLRNVGFTVELDPKRSDEGLYRIMGEDPRVSVTLEELFKLQEFFGDISLEIFNGEKTINLGRI